MNTQQHRRSLQLSSRSAMRIAWIVLIASVLVACGSPASGSDPSGVGEESAEPVSITWMVWADDVAQDENLQNEIALFNQAQSEVKVELIGVPWNDFTPKLQAMVAAGTPPDVVAIQNEADFVSKGFVAPLEPFMEQDAIDEARFLPGSLEPAYDGAIYGFRHDTAYWLLFYNKDYFDQAGVAYPPKNGWSLDEFMEVACELSNAEEMQWGMHNLNWVTGILAQQQGVPYLEMVDGVPQYLIDDPRSIAFYQRIGDFINQRNCQPTADQNTSMGGADPFIAGNAAMQLNGNWAFGNMQKNATFRWAVAPIPGLKQANVGMKIGIVSTSKKQEAAWKFLKWLTYEPEATRYRAKHGMGQPALADEQAIQTYLEGPNAPEGLPAVFEALSDPQNTFRILQAPGVTEANNILNPAVDEVMNGLGQAADVLPPAVQKANEVLAEEWDRAKQ